MKKNLLIITSQTQFQEVFTEALSNNFSIKLTADGIESLEWLENHNTVDAILIDLDMTGITCAEFIQAIRFSSTFRKTPLLLFASGVNGIVYLEYGIDDYISDPYNQLEVQLRVRNAFRKCGEMEFQESKIDNFQSDVYFAY